MQEDKQLIRTSVILSVFIALIPWIVKALEEGMQSHFTNLGIYPMKAVGLLGILTHWMVHGDYAHLISNTGPFLLGLALVFYHYRKIAFEVIAYISLTTGLWVWLIGRSDSVHIGASGVVYGLLSFLIFSGIFRKDRTLMAVSLLVVFLHGGLLYGLVYGFLDEKISYEAHLSGFLAGIVYAYWFRNKWKTQKQQQVQKLAEIELNNYWSSQDSTLLSDHQFDYSYKEIEKDLD